MGLFFKNKLWINHHEKMVPSSNNAPQSLVMYCFTEKIIAVVLVDEDFGLDGENGLYPHLVKPWANRMFLEDKNRFVISCVISNNMFVIDRKSKEVLLVEDRTGIVLDVLDDKILSLHSSPEHGQELRLGTLVEIELTTTIPTTVEATHKTEDGTTTSEIKESTTKDAASIVNETTSTEKAEQATTTPQTSLPLKKNETLPDPCQELIDSLLSEMNKEDSNEDSESARLVEASLADTTTAPATSLYASPVTTVNVVTSEVTETPEASESTTNYIQDTTVGSYIDMSIKQMKTIKMETTNILTLRPLENIHSHRTNLKPV